MLSLVLILAWSSARPVPHRAALSCRGGVAAPYSPGNQQTAMGSSNNSALLQATPSLHEKLDRQGLQPSGIRKKYWYCQKFHIDREEQPGSTAALSESDSIGIGIL